MSGTTDLSNMPFVKSKSVHVVDVVTVVCSLDLYLVLHYVNDAGWLEDWSLTNAPSHTKGRLHKKKFVKSLVIY